MEHNHGGLVQIIFLSEWVICRFQPLIFQGVRSSLSQGEPLIQNFGGLHTMGPPNLTLLEGFFNGIVNDTWFLGGQNLYFSMDCWGQNWYV